MFTKGLDEVSDMLDSTFTVVGSISDINISIAGREDSESKKVALMLAKNFELRILRQRTSYAIGITYQECYPAAQQQYLGVF